MTFILFLWTIIIASRLVTLTAFGTEMFQESNNKKMRINYRESQLFQSECPFSKSFPRYRIDLTRFSRKDESDSTGWFSNTVKVLSPFESVSRAIQKSKLERECSVDEDLYWAEDVDGVAAMSILWDRTSHIIEHSTSTYTYTSEIVALPDTSKQLVQNFVEIMDWMNENYDKGQVVSLPQVSILTESLTDISVPAIRIQYHHPTKDANEKHTLSSSSSSIKERNVDILTDRTMAWVKRILVQQGICPFTKSDRKSGHGLSDVGVPVGKIAYYGSFANHPCTLFSDTWRAITEMIQMGPSGKDGISSILLAAPNYDHNFDLWAGPIFAMLEASVVAAQAQEQIGVVCFHPQYATPDGKSWPGFGHMHSVPRLEKWYQENSERKDLTTDQVAAGGAWQRRTPHATINVLRADQLEKAESKRASGKMYTENIEKLICDIGSTKLANDLERERSLGA